MPLVKIKKTDAPRLKTLSNNVPDLLDHPGLRHHLRRLLRRGQESQVTSDHTLHRIHTLLEAIFRKAVTAKFVMFSLHTAPKSTMSCGSISISRSLVD